MQESQQPEEHFVLEEQHEWLLIPEEESLRLVEEPSQDNEGSDTEDETDEEMKYNLLWRGERYLRE